MIKFPNILAPTALAATALAALACFFPLGARAQFANGGASVTGTVSSVAITMPSPFTVSGSPITNSGIFAVGLASQPANTFFVSPNGAAGAPLFRSMATADLPASLGTPLSLSLANATGLPLATGVTGTLPVANGGTGTTASTGTGSAVLSTSPVLVTPNLGTPSAAILKNAIGLPLTTGVTGTLPVANGGTGTSTPALVAGPNVTITGAWPNQTITGDVSPVQAPQRTVYTTGSGTYTTPTGATWLEVKAWAGGGSGSNGATPPASGVAGGNTTFGAVMALGGGGGGSDANTNDLANGGAGGVVTLGSPASVPGQAGGVAQTYTGQIRGGSSFGYTGGMGVYYTNIAAAPPAWGYGAGGGALYVAGSIGAGGGGGAYDDIIITNPAASYSYTVGAGGAAVVTGSFVSGAGAPGEIIIVAHFGG